MGRQPLSNVDAAWLHMEEPTNLMMITGFFQFDRPLDFERIKQTLEVRFLKFRRFRQRVVESRLPLRPPQWEDDRHFDLDAHLHRVALPAPADQAAMMEMINDLVATPLDFHRPLWQFHYIENAPEGPILFCRLHHCIADGIALMHVLLSLCDEDADAPWPEPAPARSRQPRGLLPTLFAPAYNAIGATRKVAELMLHEGMEMLMDPAHALERGKEAASFAQRLGRLTLLPPDPKTAFKGKLGISKRAAWSQPIPLADVKRVGKLIGGTVNDVLLTTMAGALRGYLIGRGEEVEGKDIRAMIPVNLRPPAEAFKLGNHFGLVVLALPIGLPDPIDRLLALKKRMDDLKNSPEALVGFTILNAMGLAPTEIESLGVQFFASKATAVMTNVPGPQQQLYFAGAPIEKVMFWVPQSGRMGMGVSIFSYAGNVHVGLITDAGLVPNPEEIIAGYHEEFARLQALADEVEALAYKESAEPEAAPAPAEPTPAPTRCQGITQAGQPCKKPAQPGSPYCHIHARLAAAEAATGQG